MKNMIDSIDNIPLILIVDDIPKNLQLLSSILSSEGYHIAFASNGMQALTVVESAKPDLILLDIMMPELDGYEVCKRLKENDSFKDIPIIFLTGRVESEDVVRGFKVGAVDYVTKPFNSVELLVRVKNHLELKKSKDELIKKNNQLNAYQIELEQLIATKDKFFSIIAHDLRGPFSGFLGLSEVLATEYDQLEKEEVIQISESMNKAAGRLFNFLENLLEWSSTQTGRLEINPTNLDFSSICDKTFNLLSINALEKGIKLVNNVEKNTFIFADSNIIQTIMRNLISNAIKFTRLNGQIEVYVEDYFSNYLKVFVKDNGVGMDTNAIEKVFKLETKYTTFGTNNETGSGLGLVLCKELVEKSGGQIFIDSKVNEGTVISFTILKSEL